MQRTAQSPVSSGGSTDPDDSVSPEACERLSLKKALRTPSVYIIGALGFSAGLPLFLIFSSLSVWLKEVGVSKGDITYFSWAVLAFSLKFTWAPLLDLLPIPGLTKSLGQRRAWLIAAQAGIIASIVIIAMNDPAKGLSLTIIGCLALAISAATQDIALDAYRIEIAPNSLQGLLASSFIFGYRSAMIASGAGALFLADYLGMLINPAALDSTTYVYSAWKWTYLAFVPLALIGPICTFFAASPPATEKPSPKASDDGSKLHHAEQMTFTKTAYARFFIVNLALTVSLVAMGVWLISQLNSAVSTLHFVVEGVLNLTGIVFVLMASLLIMRELNRVLSRSGWLDSALMEFAYLRPFYDFIHRHGRSALLILSLVALYRVSDVFIGVIANLFYLDMGYSKSAIASVSKVYGLALTIIGSFAGGLLFLKIGNWPTLLIGALLAAATNIGFIALHHSQATYLQLTLLISFDNFCAGLGMTAFIAWMSSLTSRQYTAVQYALLSSLMTLLPKFFAGFSGSIVETAGYDAFFTLTILGGLPCIILILILMRKTHTLA